ncbi:unnamed protein product [Ixodes pacificus]
MNCVRACSRSSRILRQVSPSVTGIALTWPSATRTCRLWKCSNALTLCSAVSSTHCLTSIAMSDSTGSPRKPSVPSVTAIALSKKNLPGFSQERCETDSHGESKPPPDDSAETYLRSVLGIGLQVSDTHTDGTEQAETLPRSYNASAEDPAIVEWGLRAEVPVSATKAEDSPRRDKDAEDSTVVDVSTRKSRRKGRKKRRANAVAPEDNIANDSPATLPEETVVEDVESSLIAELPAGAVSCSSTEDENDVVYSLKPLFTGAFNNAGKDKKSKKERPDPVRQRPNYFVALQVNDVGVHKAARRVQEHLCSVKPEIVPFLIPIATLHITVLVLRVVDDHSLQRAKDALHRSHARLKDDFEQAPLTLEFKGLANFGGKVLYVKTADEGAHRRLQTLSDVCLEEFVKANLDLSAHKDFKPHLTLAKLSRVTKREKVVKRIEAEWYSEFVEESFGSQRVNGVQLLSMNKPKDKRGYYYNSLQLDFAPTEKTGPHDADHTECCRPFIVASQTVSSSLQKKHKLLQELESAKQEVKRKVSSVTEDALKRMAGSASVETTREDGQE